MLNYRFLISAVALCLVSYFSLSRISLYLSRRRFQAEHGCKPVQARLPSRDPLFGLDLMWEALDNAKNLRLLESMDQRFQRLGVTTFRSRLFGSNVISTIEPQNIKTILSLRFKDYGLVGRKRALGPLLGKGIFVADGESWARSRALLRPNFARDAVADLAAFERHIKYFFKLIPRDGSTVNLQDLFFRFTIDSATEFLFGHSVHSLKAAVDGSSDDNFAWAFNYAQDAAVSRFRLGPLSRLRKDPKEEKAIKVCHEFVDQFVDDAVRYREMHNSDKHVTSDKYVFLHELARATDNKRRLRDELLNVLLAGRDTTASLLSNMFFMVARNTAIWGKLQAEVAELGGGMPNYDQLRNLKYLRYCLNECKNVFGIWFPLLSCLTSILALRLHPVVPANSRTAICDTFLPLGGGSDGKSPLFVPKGTLVGYNAYAMHRRMDYFGSDAETFRPERWETLRPGWEYLPFNGGPRICLGRMCPSHISFPYKSSLIIQADSV